MLSFLSSLPISVLRSLDICTEANNSMIVLRSSPNNTKSYTQHALRHYVHSDINHKRHFINFFMEFIGLPSIFKNRSVISAKPA